MARVCLYCARFPFEPIHVTPLGIGYLFSFLVHNGIAVEEDIRIVDSIEEAIEFRPDILGVSSVSQVLSDARQFAKKCKEATGSINILGGYHITCLPDSLPEEFDIAVIGEGELTISEIVKEFRHGLPDNKILSNIKGICYREGNRTVRTDTRERIEHIDSLPWPKRHRTYSPAEPVFTSRGCPYSCTYCASQTFWGKITRFRSARSVVEEITHLVDIYKPDEIAILDDLWIAKKKRFREIVEMLAERGIPDKVTFSGFCRSNIVTEQDILLFKKLNYNFVRFGAETGSQRLLQRIKGKNISVSDHQRVIDLCSKHGLACGASFMFGVPGESREDIDLTVEFLRKNRGKCRISGFYLCNPIPGTPLWRELTDTGNINENLPMEQLQLDFLKPNFSWDNLLYFNEDNVPLEEFRHIIENIKNEFIVHSGGERAIQPQKETIHPSLKLEFGCGESVPKEGCLGVDVRKFDHVTYVCNAWEINKFVSKGSVEEIYSRHFFEHLTFAQADLTLKAWWQILGPDGTLHIIVPDIGYHIQQFQNPNHTELSEVNPQWTVREHALAGLWGWQREGQSNAWDIHKSGYDFRLLKMKLLEHGFSEVMRIDDQPWNLNVSCRKALRVSPEKAVEQTSQNVFMNEDRRECMEKNVEKPEYMVSVIVPTYNRPEMLAETVKSILEQTFGDFEIIVVNDAGPDVSVIVDDLNKDNNITYVRHSVNRGLAAARNTGIKLSRGKYIAYLDDDDIYYPDHLETLVNYIEGSDHKIAYTDAHRAHQVKEEDKYITTKIDLPYSLDFDYDKILVTNFVPVLSFMHEKECLKETGLFDESLRVLEDWDLWIRMSRIYEIPHIKKVTAEFRARHDGSSMTSQGVEDFYKTGRIVHKKYWKYAKNKPHVQEGQDQVYIMHTFDLMRRNSPDRAGFLKSKITEANKLISESKFSQAIDKYADLVKNYPNIEIFYRVLCDIYSEDGRSDIPTEWITGAMTFDPGYSDSLIEMCSRLVKEKKYEDAEKILSTITEVRPDNEKALERLDALRSERFSVRNKTTSGV